MIVEKIKNNKFKISISLKDLADEGINFHTFMSSNLEKNEFFRKILFKIEKDFNFSVDYKNLLIDTFYVADANFIIIITNEENELLEKPRVTVSRFENNEINTTNIYKFSSINELRTFIDFIKNTSKIFYKLLIKCPTYTYNELYFLIINQNEISEQLFLSIDKYLSEFSFKINRPNNFYIKLIEYGMPISLFAS